MTLQKWCIVQPCGKNGTYVIEYSNKINDLPEFEEFSNAYNMILTELLPEFRNSERKPEEALIKLGETIWDRLFEIYGIKPVFEGK